MKRIVQAIFFLVSSMAGYCSPPAFTDTPAIARPFIFEQCFSRDGFPIYYDSLYMPYDSFYMVPVGEINVETGKLIACTAEKMHSRLAYVQTFPKGTFPVQASFIVDCLLGGPANLAYVRVLFSNKPVKRWEFATLPNQSFPPHDIPDTVWRPECYDGDLMSSTVIIDSAANQDFSKDPHRIWRTVFVDKLAGQKYGGYIYRFGKHSLAALNCTVAPCRRTYIGYDEKGNICRLLLDTNQFQLPPSAF